MITVKVFAGLVLLSLFLTGVNALDINPSTDLLIRSIDGEYLKLFGPRSFYFDGYGFDNPVFVYNGTAHIGGVP